MYTVQYIEEAKGYVGYRLGDWAKAITGVCATYGQAWASIACAVSDRAHTRNDIDGVRRWKLA